MTSSVGIELLSASARVTSIKSAKGVGVTDIGPDPKIGPQGHLGPIKTKLEQMFHLLSIFLCFNLNSFFSGPLGHWYPFSHSEI